MTTHDEQARAGIDAQQVLDNPAYQKAMAMLREQIVDEWGKCPVRDQDGQRLLLQLFKLSQKFEGTLSGMVQTGKLAQLRLDEERDESKPQRILRRMF